jgi:hypothetical protein
MSYWHSCAPPPCLPAQPQQQRQHQPQQQSHKRKSRFVEVNKT